MRAKILLPLTILGLGVLILLLESPRGFSQQKGKGKGGGFDPGQIFDTFLSKGRGYVLISEMTKGRQEIESFAKKQGITNDKITREQYLQFYEMRNQLKAALSFDKMAQGQGAVSISEVRDPDRRAEMAVFAKKLGITGDKLTHEQYMKFYEMRDEIKAGLSFDKMSQGKGFFVISEVRDPDRRAEMGLFAKKIGAAEDKLTQGQYLKFLEMRDQIREELRGGNGSPANQSAGDSVERQFKYYDRNGDGFLNQDEIQTTRFFKNEWEKWDANKDGKINLEEWRAYSAVRDQQMPQKGKDSVSAKSTSSGGIDVIVIEEFGRGEMWRAGKLPELPDWFKEIDTTKSGQIAMYQWTKAGKPLDEFLVRDLNDDGLLTAEEVVRYERMKMQAANRTNGQAASIADRPASANGNGPTSERPPKGKGKGGKKGG